LLKHEVGIKRLSTVLHLLQKWPAPWRLKSFERLSDNEYKMWKKILNGHNLKIIFAN